MLMQNHLILVILVAGGAPQRVIQILTFFKGYFIMVEVQLESLVIRKWDFRFFTSGIIQGYKKTSKSSLFFYVFNLKWILLM